MVEGGVDGLTLPVGAVVPVPPSFAAISIMPTAAMLHPLRLTVPPYGGGAFTESDQRRVNVEPTPGDGQYETGWFRSVPPVERRRTTWSRELGVIRHVAQIH